MYYGKFIGPIVAFCINSRARYSNVLWTLGSLNKYSNALANILDNVKNLHSDLPS